MSLNVGNISARFGLDPAEFLEKMRGVSGATKFFSDEMKRDMRSTSREGAESFRLIDEALGIHISRPLTKLLTREFPAFASALQSILGVGAAGALAMAGFEVFEKVSKAIEKAHKAQEELRTATANTASVFAQEMAAYKEKDKAITDATEKVNKLIEAQEKQMKAAEAAAGPWSHLLAAIGEFATKASSFQSTIDISTINKQLGDFKQKYDTAAFTDSIHRSHEAMKLLTAEIAKAAGIYAELAREASAGHAWYAPGRGIPKEEVDAAKAYLEFLKQIKAVEAVTEAGEHAKQAKEAATKVKEFYAEIASARAKAVPDADPIHKLGAEITAARVKAVEDFEAMRKAHVSALNLDHALAALSRLEALQDRVLAAAKASAAEVAAAAKLPANLPASDTGLLNSRPAPHFAVPNVMPTLGAGGLAGAQFDSFAKDDERKLQDAKRLYEEAMTPLEKYKLGVRELDQLVHDHLIDDTARAAGMAELDRQMVKAADSAHKLQEEMQKLLERSNSAAAGVKAFGIQLQINAAENGKFAYDALTASTKGAEADAASSLMMILESQRGGHLKLIHDLETLWSGYFKNLAEMGLKHGMDQLLGPVGKLISGGKGPADAMKDAALTANTQALVALTARMSFAGAGGAGAASGAGGRFSGGGAISDIAGAAIPFFAAGGDATPGSSFISGEAGAEEVSLDGRGGAHITPLGVAGSGGDTHQHFDMRGSVVTDELMRRTEGIAAIHASEGRMRSAMPTMQREIGLRKRN